MTSVLIVEDSPVMQELLKHILQSDPALQVVGVAGTGEEALALVQRHQPDVVTMDLVMPGLNGFETTRLIMESHPVPIVVVSSLWNPQESDMTFRAMSVGALAVVRKPPGPGHAEYQELSQRMIQTVKLMAEVKVVRRWARGESLNVSGSRVAPGSSAPARSASGLGLSASSAANMTTGTITKSSIHTASAKPAVVSPQARKRDLKLVVIGTSTGGPPALYTLLETLPPTFELPIVIVQHIIPGFLQGLVDWLQRANQFPVQIATQGELLLGGHVYLAPDNFQCGIDANRRITLRQAEPEGGLRPAVSYLFRSVMQLQATAVAAVLLTGMGRDGAEELKLLCERGAVTFAQDQNSSVVYGMPGEAIRLGAAEYIMPPAQIAEKLAELVRK